MKTAIILMALCLVGALADGIGGHRHGRNQRQGRRSQGVSSRRQGRNRASFRSAPFRRGRQEDLDAVAPVDGYGAAETTAAPEVLPPPADYPDYGLDTYEAEAPIGAYGADALDDAAAVDDNLAMLEKAVPGIPGEDYPINAEVPETPFSCEGQVDGGYYADPEAQCQVFHICTADGQGGLAKYSFLCPNGTIFNQNYFICDWWFNFDCAEAEGLYGRNDEIAAERDALAAEAGGEAPADSYGAAPEAALDDAAYYDYEEAAPIDEYAAEEVVPTYEAETEAPLDTYAADEAVLPTAIPTYEESESREARRFSGRRGRNGRRNNSSQRQGRKQGGSRRQNNNRRGQRQQQGRRGRNFRG